MLTVAAINERKWGSFPALRRILESKRVPESYFGPMSVSDNVFDRLHRTLEVALITCDSESDIMDTVRASGSREILEDLDTLRRALNGAISLIEDTSRTVRQLQEAAYLAGQSSVSEI